MLHHGLLHGSGDETRKHDLRVDLRPVVLPSAVYQEVPCDLGARGLSSLDTVWGVEMEPPSAHILSGMPRNTMEAARIPQNLGRQLVCARSVSLPKPSGFSHKGPSERALRADLIEHLRPMSDQVRNYESAKKLLAKSHCFIISKLPASAVSCRAAKHKWVLRQTHLLGHWLPRRIRIQVIHTKLVAVCCRLVSQLSTHRCMFVLTFRT